MVAAEVSRFRAFYDEVLRVKWMALAAVMIVILRATGAWQDNAALLLLYKPALAAIGFITAHIAYQQAFPYIDQEALLRSANQAEPDVRQRNALLFVGTCVLRGLVYAAFILGVTLGL